MHKFKSFWRRTATHAIIWLSAATGAFALVGMLWFWWLNISPTVQIPTPVLPSPNGYDALIRVNEANPQKYGVDEAVSRPDGDHPHIFTLAEKDALIAANAPALAGVRAALKMPYYTPPFRSLSAPFASFAKMRALARLLKFDAQVKEAHGEYHGAVNSRIDGIQMGITIPRGGGIIFVLVGIACEQIGEKDLWDDMDHLNADQAADAAERLEGLATRRVPFADAQQEEKREGQTALLELFRNRSTFAAFTLLQPEEDSDDNLEQKAQALVARCKAFAPLLTHSKRRIFADYTATENAFIAQESLPYNPQPPKISLPTDPINAAFGSSQYASPFVDRGAQMQSGLLTTALALRAYRLRQGYYPASLDDLVTTHILRRVPSDPFAPAFHIPLRYRPLSADKYLLYSVGPDGKDDGGKPIPPKGDDETSRYRSSVPWQGDLGDWVVGVNSGAR